MTALTTMPGPSAIREDAAFEAMVRNERRRLWVLALSILRDQGEAEDAVQETLVKAWRSRATLGDFAAAGPWLSRVCVNQCISRRRHLLARVWARQLPADGRAAPDRALRDDLIDVDRAFVRLSVRQRAAVSLNVWQGYSVDECAEIMDCRPGTVRSHLARGLKALNKELRDG